MLKNRGKQFHCTFNREINKEDGRVVTEGGRRKNAWSLKYFSSPKI